MKSLDALAAVGNRNPPLADCYLYLGLYDYVKGELQKKLRFILFWRAAGGKTEGIRKLEFCRQHSLFSRTAAAQTLLGIYVREQEWSNAEATFREIISYLPGNRPARWTLANGYFEARQWSKAAPVYHDLVKNLVGVPGLAQWQVALCQYRLAECAYETGSRQESLAFCRAALGQPGQGGQFDSIRKDTKHLMDRIQSGG
jgi:tetratricopeptide (TPR) repeat protein